MKRAIIVGTGAVSTSHAQAYGDPKIRERAELTGVVDIDESRARAYADEHGVPNVYATLEDALSAERPDLVHICTPPWLHAEQSIAALASGAWVLCEKPPCASLAELDAIERAERSSGTYCATVFQWRYGSGMAYVHHALSAGEFGRPLVAVCNTLWYRGPEYFAVPWRGKWKTEVGGPTVGHGIHLMDSLLWLLGDWSDVSARTATLNRDIEVEDVSVATIRFSSGALATVINSVLSPRQETYLRIDCELGTIEATGLYSVTNKDWRWTGVPSTVDLGTAGAVTEKHAGELKAEFSIPVETPMTHAGEILAVYECMADGRAPLTTGRERRRTVDLIASIYKSASTGQIVRAGSIVDTDPFYPSMHPVAE